MSKLPSHSVICTTNLHSGQSQLARHIVTVFVYFVYDFNNNNNNNKYTVSTLLCHKRAHSKEIRSVLYYSAIPFTRCLNRSAPFSAWDTWTTSPLIGGSQGTVAKDVQTVMDVAVLAATWARTLMSPNANLLPSLAVMLQTQHCAVLSTDPRGERRTSGCPSISWRSVHIS